MIQFECISRPVLHIMLGLVNVIVDDMTELTRKIEPDLSDISSKRVELDLARQKSKSAETDLER